MSNDQLIELSMELPMEHINTFSQYEDLGFCIAPYLHTHDAYAQAYSTMLDYGKDVIIDNGLYEQGTAFDIDKLLQVCSSMFNGFDQPVIIAPDTLGNSVKSHEATEHFRRRANDLGLTRIGAVVHGRNLNEMRMYHAHLVNEGYEPICLSFLTPRIDLLSMIRMEYDRWYHLLGMYTLDEIAWIRYYIPLPKRVSLDTSKPLKAAWCNKDMLRDDCRALGTWSPTCHLDDAQLQLAMHNMFMLKNTLQGCVGNGPLYTSLERNVSSKQLGQGPGTFDIEGRRDGTNGVYPSK